MNLESVRIAFDGKSKRVIAYLPVKHESRFAAKDVTKMALLAVMELMRDLGTPFLGQDVKDENKWFEMIVRPRKKSMLERLRIKRWSGKVVEITKALKKAKPL